MSRQKQKAKKAEMKFKVNFSAFRTIRSIEQRLERLHKEVTNKQRLLTKTNAQLWYAFKANARKIEVQL